MALFDLSLDELWDHRSASTEPADFDDFWDRTLTAARERAVPATFTDVATGLGAVRTTDVTFSGFDGQPVRAWLNRPATAGDGPLPVVVEFIGYGGGRGLPHDWLLWSAAGYAHLVMDTRGQGGGWQRGDTPDPAGSGPQTPGFLTRGVLDKETYYYRRLVTDAVRAVETAAELPFAGPVVVTGMSQGGGLALAASGLCGDRVAAAVAGVPFLCDIRRAVTITDNEPYAEFARFCRLDPSRAAAALATVDYVDAVHFSRRATAPTLVSAALMDLTCPPSTVFAAFHELRGPKEIEVYEWEGHEGGRGHWRQRAIDFVARTLTGS